MKYPIDRVLARYTHEKGVPIGAAKEHEQELKRYLALRALNPTKRFPMSAGPIDDLWHNFVLFTQEYAKFCDHIAGNFIDHHPGPPNPTQEDIADAQRDFDRFVETYKGTYGNSPSPTLWPRIGEPGVLWSC